MSENRSITLTTKNQIMFKRTFGVIFILSALLFSFSCDDDEESTECASCTILQVITMDGVEIGRQELNTNQEFCGEALDAVRMQESTVTQEIGGYTQEIVTTVDCN